MDDGTDSPTVVPGPNNHSERPGYFQPPPSDTLPKIEAAEAEKMLDTAFGPPLEKAAEGPSAVEAGSAEVDMSEIEGWNDGEVVLARPPAVLDFSALPPEEPAPDSKEATLSRIEGSIGVKLAELASSLDEKKAKQLEKILLRGELPESENDTRFLILSFMKALDVRYKQRTSWEKTSYTNLLEAFLKDLGQREDPGLREAADKLFKRLESGKNLGMRSMAKRVQLELKTLAEKEATKKK